MKIYPLIANIISKLIIGLKREVPTECELIVRINLSKANFPIIDKSVYVS